MLDLALYVGMSVDEYWHGDPRLINNYIEAHNRKQKDKEYYAWLNGMYIRAAVKTTVQYSIPIIGKVPKLPDYPDPPVYQETQEREITEAEKIAFQHDLYMRYKALCKK